jgi:hypothetical protein
MRICTYRLFLLGDTNGSTTATSGLGVLTANTETPVVTETTMSTDLLQALKILTHLVVKTVGQNLRVLAINNVLLSVKEPVGDLVLAGVLKDGDDTLQFFVGQLAGSLVEIDIGLLAGNVGITTTNTLDGSQSNHNLVLSVNVSVEKTKNVLELILVGNGERL